MLRHPQQLDALLVGGEHGVEQGDRAARRFLRHRADAPVARPGHVALIGVQLAQNHFQQRRFARAVAPDKANAPPRGEAGRGPVQDFAPRDADDDVVNGEHLGGRIAQERAVTLRGSLCRTSG